jgi:hypothetical protein
MNIKYLRRLVRESVYSYLNEAEDASSERKDRTAKQVKAFMNSLEKSPLAKKLKGIDTPKEKLEILVKFAEIIDFPKDKISKLSSQMRDI